MTETVFTNANIVLAESVISGSVLVRDGVIVDISQGDIRAPSALNFDGDLLIPGLVELHTDALEGHMTPRPGADWPAVAAVVAHDNQLAGAGITTVLDAIALGAVLTTSVRVKRLSEMVESLSTARDAGILRADHLLHLRCEVTYQDLPEVFEALSKHEMVRLASLMDHTPGQRQFVNPDKYRQYYQGKYKLSDAEMETFIEERCRDQVLYGDKHRRIIVDICQQRGISLASHDDATKAHVDEALKDGVIIAEFPTTFEAAKASHDNGIKVMMGAPNVVRGGSHSGNISARDLAGAGVLDIISSDYVPSSLLHSAMILEDVIDDIDLPTAVRAVTKNPAEGAGLMDRGEITPGRRADLVRVHRSPHHPIVRGVWRQGVRVA